VACARWETAHITEWLVYHASIGFDHVYLYCNDDDPAELYAEVLPFLAGPAPFVTFLHFPFKGQQRGIYTHFLKTRLHESAWISFLDVDEFLYLARDPSINAYLTRVAANADAIYFNWLMFGNSGHAERPPGSVLETYTRHEAILHPYTKVLVRTSCVDLSAVLNSPRHFWHDWPPGDRAPRRVNVLGEPMDNYYHDFPVKAAAKVKAPGMLQLVLAEAVLCHFSLKSEADFERRVQRGTAGEFAMQVSWAQHKQSGHYKAILDGLNAVEFTALRDYWRGLHGAIPAVIASPPGANLAVGKPARQSSVSPWSLHPSAELDAAGAVSGKLTGRYQFHTGEDDDPWWQVDLGRREQICEIRVFNRLDVGAFRARHLSLSLSDDGLAWREIFRKMDDAIFGGVDGAPLRWLAISPVVGRFLRIALIGRGILHLDQVEVYGC
jgi:hypothetical protein